MISMHRRGLLALGAFGAGTLAAPAVLRAQTQVTTLADTMAADSRFARFLDLVSRAGMVETFRQAQPMTVFAPIDAAFLGAPAGIMQQLTGSSGQSGTNTGADRPRIAALINYHIVPGALGASALSSGQRLRTANGSDIAISGNAGALTLQNPAPAQQMAGFGSAGANVSASPARIVQPDIRASNGVIHAIDQIIWP